VNVVLNDTFSQLECHESVATESGYMSSTYCHHLSQEAVHEAVQTAFLSSHTITTYGTQNTMTGEQTAHDPVITLQQLPQNRFTQLTQL